MNNGHQSYINISYNCTKSVYIQLYEEDGVFLFDDDDYLGSGTIDCTTSTSSGTMSFTAYGAYYALYYSVTQMPYKVQKQEELLILKEQEVDAQEELHEKIKTQKILKDEAKEHHAEELLKQDYNDLYDTIQREVVDQHDELHQVNHDHYGRFN